MGRWIFIFFLLDFVFCVFFFFFFFSVMEFAGVHLIRLAEQGIPEAEDRW